MPERSGKTDTPIPSASGPMWASAPTKIFRLPESIWKQNNSMRGKFTNSRGVNNPPEHFVNNQVLTVGIGPYKKQRAFSALGAMPTKSTFVFSVGGDALIAPWGAFTERSEKTDTPIPSASGPMCIGPYKNLIIVFLLCNPRRFFFFHSSFISCGDLPANPSTCALEAFLLSTNVRFRVQGTMPSWSRYGI